MPPFKVPLNTYRVLVPCLWEDPLPIHAFTARELCRRRGCIGRARISPTAATSPLLSKRLWRRFHRCHFIRRGKILNSEDRELLDRTAVTETNRPNTLLMQVTLVWRVPVSREVPARRWPDPEDIAAAAPASRGRPARAACGKQANRRAVHTGAMEAATAAGGRFSHSASGSLAFPHSLVLVSVVSSHHHLRLLALFINFHEQ
jgi:hypothetical protein